MLGRTTCATGIVSIVSSATSTSASFADDSDSASYSEAQASGSGDEGRDRSRSAGSTAIGNAGVEGRFGLGGGDDEFVPTRGSGISPPKT